MAEEKLISKIIYKN